MAKVFFSYSHRDEEFRNELEKHLSMLKKQGVIEVWHDHRIMAGEEIDHTISKNLEEANVVLLLTSSDFLASDYCYDIEVQRAMAKHEEGSARVIPVILRPCDWHHAPFGRLRATPKDGKPISKYPDRDEAFLDVVQDIRNAVVDNRTPARPAPVLHRPAPPRPKSHQGQEDTRSSNLRIKQEFSDRDKDRFLTETFEYIANFFDNSLQELARRNPVIETDFRRVDANHFTAAVYKNGRTASECKIWMGRGMFSKGISYSTDRSSSDNSLNDALSIEEDGYSLAFRAFNFLGQNRSLLTQQGAAEYLWDTFISRLQN